MKLPLLTHSNTSTSTLKQQRPVPGGFCWDFLSFYRCKQAGAPERTGPNHTYRGVPWVASDVFDWTPTGLLVFVGLKESCWGLSRSCWVQSRGRVSTRWPWASSSSVRGSSSSHGRSSRTAGCPAAGPGVFGLPRLRLLQPGRGQTLRLLRTWAELLRLLCGLL